VRARDDATASDVPWREERAKRLPLRPTVAGLAPPDFPGALCRAEGSATTGQKADESEKPVPELSPRLWIHVPVAMDREPWPLAPLRGAGAPTRLPSRLPGALCREAA
jgi:hypothetical protein